MVSPRILGFSVAVHRREVAVLCLVFLCALCAVTAACSQGRNVSSQTAVQASSKGVDGERAMAHARAVVRFGPRPPGSAAIKALRKYIHGELRRAGVDVEEQPFVAKTPNGDVPMVNVIGKIPGSSGKRILLTGHYDTKQFPNFRFVGANDAGSSTALLLELATVLAKGKHHDEIWIVFFDGEEAFHEWTATDSLYGSRHLAKELKQRGEIGKIKALINVDMIGDRDLNLALEYNSDPRLRETLAEVAASQGHREIFDRFPSAIEDDHMPFAQLGVPVLNLIDFSYGPGHAYWHTEADTIDKLSASSLRIVGDLVLGMLDRLDR